MIVLIGGEKGGTGKSTLAVNLAAMLALNGRDVLLVDTDTQPSASMWGATRDEEGIEPRVPCIQKSGKGLGKQLLDLAERYQEIVVDAGGRDSMELRYALGVAEKAFVPIRPGQFDSWTLERMDRLVEQMAAVNPELEVKLLISCASSNLMIQEAKETREFIEDENFEYLRLADSVIRERIVYRKAVRDGRSIIEYFDPRSGKQDEKAIEELNKLYAEIYYGGK